MFAEIDVDGGDTIDAGELRTLMQKLGKYLTARELELAVQVIDADGSGEIDYEEFHAWWRAGGLNAGGDFEGMVGARVRSQAVSRCL